MPNCKNVDLLGAAKPGYYFGNPIWNLTYHFEQKKYYVASLLNE
jgi:hypothetical protein